MKFFKCRIVEQAYHPNTDWNNLFMVEKLTIYSGSPAGLSPKLSGSYRFSGAYLSSDNYVNYDLYSAGMRKFLWSHLEKPDKNIAIFITN